MNTAKIKSALAWTLIATMSFPGIAHAGQWEKQNDVWYYQENGSNQTGWIQEKGNWYFLNQNGVMQTGWYQDAQNDRYYLNRLTDGVEGLMRTGWFSQDGKWYFLNTVHDGFYGRAIAGTWQWIDGYCYLFDGQGAMYADCVTPDGYTVNQDGRWTVDGVVQYIAGKGILTKQAPGGSGSRGGGSGSGRPNGGNPGGDKPDENNPGGDTGDLKKLTVQYIVKDSGEILKTKEVSGKENELYVVQHPSIEGYKILDGQPLEARFAKDAQEVKVYYREKEEGEAPDQSIVVSDNLKAIIPETEEEIAMVNSMRSEIFSYEILDEETAELSVSNENPLLSYILDGTYEENDIIYIVPCDAFPTGLSLIYLGHDDRYSGEFDGYDADAYEVIHVRLPELFDIIQEGTYIDNSLYDYSDIEMVHTWMPEMDEEEPSPQRMRKAKEPSITYEIENNNVTIGLEKKFASPANIELNASVNFELDKPDIEIDVINDFYLRMQEGIDTSITGSGKWNIGGDISDILGKYLQSKENKTELNLNFLWGKLNLGELEGVSLENSYILFAAGWKFARGTAATFTADLNDIFNDSATVKDIEPIGVGLVFLDLSGSVNLSVNTDVGISTYINIGGEAYHDKNGWHEKDLSGIFKSKGSAEKGCIFKANSIADANAEVRMGPGFGAGLSILGIIPAMGKLSAGIEASGNFSGLQADFDSEKKGSFWDKWEMKALSGSADVSIYALAEAMLRVKGQIGKGDSNNSSGGLSLPVAINIHPVFWDEKWPLIHYPIEDGMVLKIHEGTSERASNAWGIDISGQFQGYDSKSGTVKPLVLDKDSGAYSFQCPQYIIQGALNKKEYRKITGITLVNTPCEKIDLSKAPELKTILAKNTNIKNLDVSNNEKVERITVTDCENLETFKGNGKVIPTGLQWYEDPQKTRPTTTCAKGRTIYSENYNRIHWQDKELTLTMNTSLKAVDEQGNEISDQFSGYDPATKTVKVEKLQSGKHSFSCPQYIMEESKGKKNYYKITGIILRSQGAGNYFESLDISKALDLETLTLSEPRIERLDMSKNEKLREISITTKNEITQYDFTENRNLESLTLEYGLMTELDLRNNRKLKKLSLSGSRALETLTLPQNSILENVNLRDCEKLLPIDMADLPVVKTLNCPELNWSDIDVSNCPKLESLNLYGTPIISLDVSANPLLTSLDTNQCALHTFRGNGKANIFPSRFQPSNVTWYSDTAKTTPVTECKAGQTIYSSKFSAGTDTASLAVVKATPSDAEAADAEVRDRQTATSSNAMRKSKGTPNKVQEEEEIDDEEDEDDEVELINDLSLYAISEQIKRWKRYKFK